MSILVLPDNSRIKTTKKIFDLKLLFFLLLTVFKMALLTSRRSLMKKNHPSEINIFLVHRNFISRRQERHLTLKIHFVRHLYSKWSIFFENVLSKRSGW